jgi:hypothetical protein
MVLQRHLDQEPPYPAEEQRSLPGVPLLPILDIYVKAVLNSPPNFLQLLQEFAASPVGQQAINDCQQNGNWLKAALDQTKMVKTGPEKGAKATKALSGVGKKDMLPISSAASSLGSSRLQQFCQ